MSTAACLSPRFLLALPSDALGLKTAVFGWYLPGDSWGSAIIFKYLVLTFILSD